MYDTILSELESQCLPWKECVSWKWIRLFQSSFSLLASLKTNKQKKPLETYFTLLLSLAQSFSLQAHLDMSLYLLLAYSGLCHTIMLKLV